MSATATSSASATASAPASAPIGGRYLLLDKLGAGGMGAVYRARDEASGRIVAFKQLLSSEAGPKRKTIEALFEREYHTLVRLRHPRIIEAHDYGLTDSGPYYTMELLEGQDLQQLAPLPYREACGHLRDVASSLALIHAHRLVHRDVSPRNVRLGADGRAKLIDFGALAAFGPAGGVIGTPLCMAPEVARRMPLDQRTDLYALGAVAYWLLTGHHAYPARRFSDLAVVWQKPPASPSKLVVDIPAALDNLVMSLLSLDSLARPANAAVVIDQLTAIAKLEPEEHEHAAASYLSSGRMVGRADEQAWMEGRLSRALAGKGSEVVIDGSAGIGKTRLLHELGLQAQLKGLLVLEVDAQATPSAFGVASALAVGLLGITPEIARRAAKPHAELLAHISPELRDKLEQAAAAPLQLNPGERRARLQTALYEWFLQVARERPLLLAVDNIQAADDNSAAFLAALGREARETQLIVLVTQRTGDEVTAPMPVRALRKRSGRLKLGGLSSAACEELVKSLFGDVANTGRVARLLYDKSAGNPQLCTDLAQLLVEKKIAKYGAGTWVLPLEVSAAELPDQAEEIIAGRLERLSETARDLAEALSIDGKPVSIERCLSLAEGRSERDVYAALDELVAEQILMIEDGSYRFAQGALREAVLGRMDAARRRARHLRSAETLLAAAEERPEPRMEAAWHLLRAGEDARGADLLASTSRQFLQTQGASQNVEQIVQAMRAALEVYERLGRSDYQIAGLLFPLIPLAYYSADWRLVVRYGERAVRLGLQLTGIALAYKLRRVLGHKLALKVGLLIGGFRFARAKKRGLDYDLRQAIASVCGAIPAATGTLATLLDSAAVERMHALVQPLALFGPDQFPSVMREYVECTLHVAHGQEGVAMRTWARLIAHHQEPVVRSALGEGHWKSLYGGMTFTHALMYCYNRDARALELAATMESLGVRTWATAAAQIRLAHHAYRGESERVQHYRELVELFAVQGSTTWQAEMFLPASLLSADVLAGDTLAARRSAEQLTRRAADVPSVQLFAHAAHAGYLALRGELQPAIDLYAQVVSEMRPNGRNYWMATHAAFAQALNWAGQHGRAKQLMVDALSHVKAEAGRWPVMTLEARRQLALAEAGLGNHEQAVRMIDGLCAEYEHHDNPMLVGLLHKARAEIALLMRDASAFEPHFSAMEERFRATRNPALIAQCERLSERALRARLLTSVKRRPTDDIPLRTPASTTDRTLAELTVAPDRFDYALKLIMQRSRARSGYLYLFESSGLRLAAASHPSEPPREVEAQLLARITRAQAEADNTADNTITTLEEGAAASGDASAEGNEEKTVFIHSAPPEAQHGNYKFVLLMLPRSQERVVVGGFLLDTEPEGLFRLNQELLDATARALHESGQSTSIETLG